MSICWCGWTGEPHPAARRIAARGETRSTLGILNDLSPGTEGPRARSEWLGLAVFCAAAVCTVLWLIILGRGLTFFFDEWDFINAAATTGYWHNVLQPHNGHPSMVPFSVYEVLLRTAGLQHYWPYQLILALLDVACGWLLFVLLRRKIHPLAAAAAAAVLMLLGPAWQDLLWPFQIGFLGSVAGGLGALTLLDRNTRRADVGACACLVLAAACSGVALPFLAGVVVELAWHRRSWSRLWVPTVPIGLFIVWYETLGKSSSSSISPSALVHSVASDTATTIGAVVGRGGTAGDVLSAVFAALIVVAVVRSPGQAARLAMGASGLLTFWLLTLLTRGVSQDGASRYLYPATALVLIAAGELPKLITRNQRGQHAVGTPAWVTRGRHGHGLWGGRVCRRRHLVERGRSHRWESRAGGSLVAGAIRIGRGPARRVRFARKLPTGPCVDATGDRGSVPKSGARVRVVGRQRPVHPPSRRPAGADP